MKTTRFRSSRNRRADRRAVRARPELRASRRRRPTAPTRSGCVESIGPAAPRPRPAAARQARPARCRRRARITTRGLRQTITGVDARARIHAREREIDLPRPGAGAGAPRPRPARVRADMCSDETARPSSVVSSKTSGLSSPAPPAAKIAAREEPAWPCRQRFVEVVAPGRAFAIDACTSDVGAGSFIQAVDCFASRIAGIRLVHDRPDVVRETGR